MADIRRIGILTSGGDCPGLNAAIRGVAKPLQEKGVQIIGIQDGFRGLVENRTMELGARETSGLLVEGGTILGTSRYKPQKYPNSQGGGKSDRTRDAVANYERLHLDALVCIGGGGTHKNAYHLYQNGIPNIVTLPKTIDNDVFGTDVTFGYDTGMSIACEAIDRLHTTASSHHRCMLVDVMGHNTGWLAMGAGIAGGADVILIPEFPFSIDKVVEALIERERKNKRFSIVVVAEGAHSMEEAALRKDMERKELKARDAAYSDGLSHDLARIIEERVGIETRITTLGHLQRGGTPTARDRVLASRLGTVAADLIMEGHFGVMAAVRCNEFVAVPLEEMVGKKKYISEDNGLVETANRLGVSLGRAF
ncbi:MAG: ATP-dependent 6-phosphofructokinase [Spirochaetales bacterium]|nr:ATP-dependent 6-phosphofructokinase [Spirochaetales bacterium]